MKDKLVWLLIGFCALGFGWLSPAYGKEPLPVLGAAPGEILKFNVQWYGVPAGSAYMESRPTMSGQYSLTAGVESIGLIKFLHPIKDVLHTEGFLSPKGFVTRYFSKHQQRGDSSRLIEYRFDREWGEVVRTQEGEEPFIIGGVNPGINDLVTGFFTLRACPSLGPGANLYLPMLDGKKIYEVAASVGPSERLNTPLGWFDVLPMTVMVENSDLFRLQGSVVVWLTNDIRRMPVRVESRIDFKSVAADLIFYEDGRGGRGEMKDVK